MQSGPYLICRCSARQPAGRCRRRGRFPTTTLHILAQRSRPDELTTARFSAVASTSGWCVLDMLDDLEKNSVRFSMPSAQLGAAEPRAELRHGVAPAAAPDLYNTPDRPTPPAPPRRNPPRWESAPKQVAAPPPASRHHVSRRSYGPHKRWRLGRVIRSQRRGALLQELDEAGGAGPAAARRRIRSAAFASSLIVPLNRRR